MKTVQAAAQSQPNPVANEIAQSVAEDTIPLIQMSGASKKRKHTELEEDEEDYHPTYNLPENDLHTPVPNIQNRNSWRGRGKKRQSSGGDC